MKQLIVCTLLLLNVQLALTYKVAALNYVLYTIEFLASEYFGVFSCVFYDISRRDPYKNMYLTVLTSRNSTSKCPFIQRCCSFILATK